MLSAGVFGDLAEDVATVIGGASDMKALPLLLLSPFVFLWLFFSSFHLSLPDGSSAEPRESQADRCSSYVRSEERFFFFFATCAWV